MVAEKEGYMAGPLEGVRVVELGVWVAGPAAGGILADWGADVVKVEPPTGDPARTGRCSPKWPSGRIVRCNRFNRR